MTAYIALIMTLIQTVAIIYGYVTPVEWLFADAIVYGSPFYMFMNAFNDHSVFKGPVIYIAYMGFHIVKYGCIFNAKFKADYPGITLFAILLEVAYLGASAYYIY